MKERKNMKLINADALVEHMDKRAEALKDDKAIWEATAVETAIDMFAPPINAVPVSEGATAGDVIKAAFPGERFYSNGGWIYFEFNGRSTSFCPEAFWNSPYEIEKTETSERDDR